MIAEENGIKPQQARRSGCTLSALISGWA